MALGALAEEGLRCLRLRPFNHTGPGQSEDFVVPAFAAQIARIGRGERPPVLRVGNLEAKRDFLDVRDVVSAYLTMVEQASAFEPGMALNVSSGTAIRIGDILESLVRLAGVDVSIEVDPEKWRPVDIPVSYGDSGRLSALTGWRPLFAFNDTLIAVLNRQVTGIEQF
ncbi:MAG: GDP-mannose 4,6-dehydratase [Phyllobacteriaceae bacterium]|nr:GDP-mannose 4,6-dehydratase [Phyllobacteriaceae bacterium]